MEVGIRSADSIGIHSDVMGMQQPRTSSAKSAGKILTLSTSDITVNMNETCITADTCPPLTSTITSRIEEPVWNEPPLPVSSDTSKKLVYFMKAAHSNRDFGHLQRGNILLKAPIGRFSLL